MVKVLKVLKKRGFRVNRYKIPKGNYGKRGIVGGHNKNETETP